MDKKPRREKSAAWLAEEPTMEEAYKALDGNQRGSEEVYQQFAIQR